MIGIGLTMKAKDPFSLAKENDRVRLSPRCQFATAGARGFVTKVCGGKSLGSCSMEFRSNIYSETHE